MRQIKSTGETRVKLDKKADYSGVTAITLAAGRPFPMIMIKPKSLKVLDGNSVECVVRLSADDLESLYTPPLQRIAASKGIRL